MKQKILLSAAILILFWLSSNVLKREHTIVTVPKPESQAQSVTPEKDQNTKYNIDNISSSIFVTYWALPKSKEDLKTFDRVVYFGVSVNKVGIDKDDVGYKQLNTYEAVTKGYLGKKSLAIRMLDAENNIDILNDEKIQDTVIAEINDVVKENGFTEIALDLELSGIFNEDITNKVNVFVQKIYTLENRYYRHFSVLMYGDVFYRNRPFDIKSIGKNCDEIMIMAYDFSKPYGEPGPNFPFDRRSTEAGNFDFSYDFKQMISDYTSQVSSEKLTVIFGMYGYDWTLNKQGTPLKRAEAKSVVSLQLLVDSLKQNDSRYTLNVTRNKAKEPKIEYVDETNQKHVVWYEDEESAQFKIDYVKEKGVGSIGYWAFGYY